MSGADNDQDRDRNYRRSILAGFGFLSGLFVAKNPLSGLVSAESDRSEASTDATMTDGIETPTGTTETTTTETAETTTTEPTTTTAEGPQEGGKPTIGLAVPPDTLNPLKAGSVYSFYVVARVASDTEEETPVHGKIFVNGEPRRGFEWRVDPGETVREKVTLEFPHSGENTIEICANDLCLDFPVTVPDPDEEEEEEKREEEEKEEEKEKREEGREKCQ